MSLSAHKMYGPKGIGALYVRRLPPVRIAAQIHGGGHERGMRSGTLATHQIVGMGEASRILRESMDAENARIAALRNRLWSHLKQTGRRAGEWRSPASVAGQPECRVRRCRRRNVDDRARRHCGIDRFGVHVGDGRTVVRVARDRRCRMISRMRRCVSRSADSRRKTTSIARHDALSKWSNGCANATPPETKRDLRLQLRKCV